MRFDVEHVIEPGERVIDAVAGLTGGSVRRLFLLTDRNLYITHLKLFRQRAGAVEAKLPLRDGIDVHAEGRNIRVGRYRAQFGLIELGKIRDFVARAEAAVAAARGSGASLHRP